MDTGTIAEMISESYIHKFPITVTEPDRTTTGAVVDWRMVNSEMVFLIGDTEIFLGNVDRIELH